MHHNHIPEWKEHPKLLASSPIIWGLGVVLVIFTIAVYFIDSPTLTILSQSLRLTFSVAVAIAYTPAAYLYILQGTPEREGYLTIGIWGSWIVEAAFGLRGMIYRIYDRPDWMQDLYDVPFMILLSGVFAMMHLTAGSLKEGETQVPASQWVKVAIFASLSLLLGIALGWVAKTEKWVSSAISILG